MRRRKELSPLCARQLSRWVRVHVFLSWPDDVGASHLQGLMCALPADMFSPDIVDLRGNPGVSHVPAWLSEALAPCGTDALATDAGCRALAAFVRSTPHMSYDTCAAVSAPDPRYYAYPRAVTDLIIRGDITLISFPKLPD